MRTPEPLSPGAKLPRAPELSGPWALALVTLAVGVTVAAMMVRSHRVLVSLGDTDDATRLVMVRDLLAGQGWYNQAIMRFNPPHGLWIHWSRLLDGGIAAMMLALRTFMSPAGAEYWTRYFWPLLWVFPGVAAALALARNLGARSAVLIAAVLMVANTNAFRQFIPGRIDHHDIQIVMTVIAMACATARQDRARWAAVAGAAAALGLAIGLEALPLQALIGASYGLALIRSREAARPTAAYGASLAATAVALFLIQTPPWRWSLSFCDALALNLTVALAVAGVGLALAAMAAARPGWRIGLVAAAGAAAGVVYLALDPSCIHGPFAAMNPAVRPFWFDRIQEVQPLDKMMRLQRGAAIIAAVLLALATASGVFLAARRRAKPETTELLILAALVVAVVTAWFAWRMQDYVFWLGLPALAASLSWIAERWLGASVVAAAAAVAAALLVSPGTSGAAINAGVGILDPHSRPPGNPGPRCFAPAGYKALAALPSGTVLASQDLGPFILAFTGQSAVVAPYHRLADQILAMHQAWNAPPALAEARVRALRADYIVDCPPYPLFAGPGSFAARLRQPGPPPPWLQRLSAPGATLKIYKVLPPAP